jgi:hypothetical protein
VRQILARMSELTPSPERLREVRAVEVLEHIGGNEAEGLLRQLAAAAPAALTREAQAALARLEWRAAGKR